MLYKYLVYGLHFRYLIILKLDMNKMLRIKDVFQYIQFSV